MVVVDQEPRVDSRVIAGQLGVEHESTRRLIEQHQTAIENFGKVRFEIGASGKTNQSQKFYLLNEDQAYLLLTLTRNTEQAVELKIRLVRAFGEQRRALANPQPVLPKKRVIKSREDLSFTAPGPNGYLKHWVVPHDPKGLWAAEVELGRAYFAEVQELAQWDPEEARKAILWALNEGAARNFSPGWGIEIGFAEAIATALFVDAETKKLPRKAGNAV